MSPTSNVDRLTALRGPGQSYSDVILRLVAVGWKREGDASMIARRRTALVVARTRRSREIGRVHQNCDFNSVAKLARSGNKFERRMPRAESCLLIFSLASFGMIYRHSRLALSGCTSSSSGVLSE